MNSLTELLSRLWPLLLLIAHLGGAVAVTIHALLHKREVAAATGWIGLAWLAPVIGPILYLCLGVNRIQRKGISLGLREAWDHREAPERIQEDEMRTAELSRRYPTFVGLAQPPTPSLLRGFSAPVKVEIDRSTEQLAFLFAHDPDPFNRWDAGQTLAIQVETGKSDLKANLIKLSNFKADQKFMLATNKAAEIKIKELYEGLELSDKTKIQIAHIKDFISNPPTI